MGGDEIERNFPFDSMPNHIADPRGLSGGRPTHPQVGTSALHCPRRMIVKLKIGALFGYTGPKVDIRLIPDLEIPLHHFIVAVALHQMTGELIDQFLPFCVVFGR